MKSKELTSMLNEANQQIRNVFPDVLIECREFLSKGGLTTLIFKVTHHEDYVEFTIEFPARYEDGDDESDKEENSRVSFHIGENNLLLGNSKIANSMASELEKCFAKRNTNWIYDFLHLFITRLISFKQDKHKSNYEKLTKKKFVSQPELTRFHDSFHHEVGFKPYPSLNSFCWDPLGKLAVIRNLRYNDRKIDPNNGIREINSIDQLNNYMINCERKIRSENKLNILSNKDFMITDEEEENDFCVEFDKSVPIEADDDEEATDFLNFQMKKKKATRENKNKEQEGNEDELNDEHLKDYFPIAINQLDIEKRLSALMDGLDHNHKPRPRNRFEFSSRFQMRDFSNFVFYRTNIVENFLESFKLSPSLDIDHSHVSFFLENFFLNYSDYQGFNYWISPLSYPSKAHLEPLYLGKKSALDQMDNVPFYKNRIKLLQFKEIMNNIKISARNDDESQAKIGILKILIEIMYLKDVVHDKITELAQLLRLTISSQFLKIQIDNFENENFVLDTNTFFLIYSTMVEAIEAQSKEKKKNSTINKKLNPEPETAKKQPDIRGRSPSFYPKITSKITTSEINFSISQSNEYNDFYRLLNDKEIKSFQVIIKEVREMLNRKRNFQVRVYLDKILRAHQNYRHYNDKMDLIFKKYSNFLDAANRPETDKMKHVYVEFLRSQFLFKCSICEMKIDNISLMCRLCLHGGHLDHLNEWFTNNKHCPKCFDCQCKLLRFDE